MFYFPFLVRIHGNDFISWRMLSDCILDLLCFIVAYIMFSSKYRHIDEHKNSVTWKIHKKNISTKCLVVASSATINHPIQRHQGSCKIWIMIANYCLDCDYIPFWWDWLVSVKKFKILSYLQVTPILLLQYYGMAVWFILWTGDSKRCWKCCSKS